MSRNCRTKTGSLSCKSSDWHPPWEDAIRRSTIRIDHAAVIRIIGEWKAVRAAPPGAREGTALLGRALRDRRLAGQEAADPGEELVEQIGGQHRGGPGGLMLVGA